MDASDIETTQPHDTASGTDQNKPLFGELRQPLGLLNFFFGIVGLFGTAFGIYAFYVSLPHTTLAYSVNNQINILDQSAEAARLTIEDRAGQPVLSNVYAAEILFWNASDRYLDHSHIREPLSFQLADGSILDVRFKKAIRQDIAKFSFGIEAEPPPTPAAPAREACPSPQTGPERFLRKNFFTLSWCVLDPGFGVNIVVIYENDTQTNVAVNGYVSSITDIVDQSERPPKQRGWAASTAILIASAAGMAAVGPGFELLSRRIPVRNGVARWIIAAALLSMIILVIFAVFLFARFLLSGDLPWFMEARAPEELLLTSAQE